MPERLVDGALRLTGIDPGGDLAEFAGGFVDGRLDALDLVTDDVGVVLFTPNAARRYVARRWRVCFDVVDAVRKRINQAA